MTGDPLDGVGQEGEPPLGVGREHDVGRVLHEEPVPLLGLAQVTLESEPLEMSRATLLIPTITPSSTLARTLISSGRGARPVEEVHPDRVDGRRLVDDGPVARRRGLLPTGSHPLEERPTETVLQVQPSIVFARSERNV